MRTLVKIVAWLLGLLIAALIAAVTALALLFDPNDYKDQIAALVKHHTGREISIQGDIKLSLFPWLGIKVDRVAIGNAPGFGPEPLAEAQSAEVKLGLLPLLQKRLEFDKVLLRGMVLHLTVDRSGRRNWIIGTAASGVEQPVPKQRISPVANAAQSLSALNIAGIDVGESRILWSNQRNGTSAVLNDLSLESGHVLPGRPFHIVLKTGFSMHPAGTGGRLDLDGHLSISPDGARYTLEGMRAAVHVEDRRLPGGGVDMAVTGSVDADVIHRMLRASGLQLQLPVVRAVGDFQVSQVDSSARYTGNLRLPAFDLRALLQALGHLPETADPRALTQVTGELAFDGSGGQFDIRPLTLHVDDSALSGSIGVRRNGRAPSTFDLSVDSLDLDRYLPPRRKVPATPAEAVAVAWSRLPVDTLRRMSLEGELRIPKLKAVNLAIKNLLLRITAHDGVLQIHPAQASLYDGEYQGEIRLDARPDAQKNAQKDAQKPGLAIALNEAIRGVQVEPLLKDLQGSTWLSGRGDLSARLSARAGPDQDIRKTLAGEAGLSLHQGAVKGIDLVSLIREAAARLEGKSPAPSGTPDRTEFTELHGTVQFERGIARNDDLSLSSPLLKLTGAGSADLVSGQLDYLLKVAAGGLLESSAKSSASRALENLRGAIIPVKVTGSLTRPQFRLDLDALLGEQAKGKLQQKREEIKQKIEDRLRERLKGLL